MALILFDGFEGLPQVRSDAVATGSPAVGVGRDGVGKSLYAAGSSTTVKYGVANLDTCIVGFGFMILTSALGLNMNVVAFYGDSGATLHTNFVITTDGKVAVRRNTVVLATSTLSVSADTWHYFEVKTTIADAGGTITVKVDGVEYVTYTGDTKNAGTLASVSTVVLSPRPGASVHGYYDDVYIMDATGAAPYNDFIGERVIKATRPVGNGALSQMVGSDADSVDNYALVDDVSPDIVDYVSSETTGNADTYVMSAVSGLASVDAVQVLSYASKSDSGTKSMRTVIRDASGTTDESTDIALSTSWQLLAGSIELTDPDGAAWTVAGVNACQIGVKSV